MKIAHTFTEKDTCDCTDSYPAYYIGYTRCVSSCSGDVFTSYLFDYNKAYNLSSLTAKLCGRCDSGFEDNCYCESTYVLKLDLTCSLCPKDTDGSYTCTTSNV